MATLAAGAALVGGSFLWWAPSAISQGEAPALPVSTDQAGRPAALTAALAQAGQAARSSSTRLDGLRDLGRLYHANGYAREAEACWLLLRAAQPGEARWSYYLADLRSGAHDPEGAGQLLEETLALAPSYAPARLRLANLLFKSGRRDEAATHYRLFLAATPQDPYAQLGLARLALQAGDTELACQRLEALLQGSPHFSTGHNLYAELLAARGDGEGANRHRWLGRETLRYREPDDPWIEEFHAWCYDYDRLCVLGTLELQTAQPAAAQAWFERAITLQPEAPDAYEMLARLLITHQDAVGARDLLERAMPRLNGKNNAGIFAALSLAYRQLQRPDDAVRAAQRGLDELGPQAELLDTLGLALAAAGRNEDAVRAWQAAIGRNPGDATANYHLATGLLTLGRLDEALAALEASLTLQPTFLPTLLLRGRIELEAGHLARAERYLRPAFDSHPEDVQVRRLFADWHQRSGAAAESRGDAATAERHYRAGLDLDAQHTELLVSLGVFYLVQHRYTEAIIPLTAYQDSQPESAQACLFLGQAYAAAGHRDEARAALSRGMALAERAGQPNLANHCRRLLQQL